MAQPKALARSRQRSPNLPAVSTSTLSPGEVRFETEPSITPVPEEVSTRTSLFVPINSFTSASTREYRARKSAVRWCMAKEAMAVCAAGSRGVGPGVNRRFLRSITMGPCNRDTPLVYRNTAAPGMRGKACNHKGHEGTRTIAKSAVLRVPSWFLALDRRGAWAQAETSPLVRL